MAEKKLQGKTALITGSSQGIGRGIALNLAEEGAKVVINYRSNQEEAEAAAEAVRSLGQEALVCRADIGQRDHVQDMFHHVEETWGRIDIVVANAAYSVRSPVVDADWEDVQRTIEVSQFGTFHTCQLAAQHMVEQPLTGESRGKIIIISSILAELPPPENAAYNMAKAAVNALGETLAAELAGKRINVNIVNPGLIDTPGERRYATEEELQETGARIPWGRIGRVEDIGRSVAYLASDEADYVTGATLRVDGGFLLGLQLPPAAN